MSLQLPAAGQRTVGELHSRLVHADADSNAVAQGLSYPNVLVSSNIQAQAEDVPVYARGAGAAAGSGDGAALGRRPGIGHVVHERLAAALGLLASPFKGPTSLLYQWAMGYGLEILPGFSAAPPASSQGIGRGPLPSPQSQAPPPAAWHPHKALLAVATAAGAVHVYDLSAAEGQGPNGTRLPTTVQQPQCVLACSAVQPAVCALAWRPCHNTTLAVGTLGAVAVWGITSAGRPPLAHRSAGGKGTGPWLVLLKGPQPRARFGALTWSPDGRLLAAASPDTPGLSLWDVATGSCTQVGVGLAAFSLLRWSPCGSYLFAGGVGPRFHVWETSAWRSASWDAPAGCGPVVQAAWAPTNEPAQADGAPDLPPVTGTAAHIILMSFVGDAGRMVALHLVNAPPALVAQLMPVVLQDITAGTGGGQPAEEGRVVGSWRRGCKGHGPGHEASCVVDWAWDPTGERLAVLLAHPHPAAGCIGIYATGYDPVVHTRLLGYARPPPGVLGQGPGSGAWHARLVAHQSFAKGALITLNAAGGGEQALLFNLPLVFKGN